MASFNAPLATLTPLLNVASCQGSGVSVKLAVGGWCNCVWLVTLMLTSDLWPEGLKPEVLVVEVRKNQNHWGCWSTLSNQPLGSHELHRTTEGSSRLPGWNQVGTRLDHQQTGRT